MEKTGASARQWRGGSVKRRWFVSKGYLVEYFEAAPRVGQAPRPKGAFDLRYVERLQPSDDATAPPLAFEVVVGSGGGGKSRKFTFAAVAPADGGSADAEREAWLRLWTAAAPEQAVAAAWRHKRSTALAQEIEGAYAGAQKKVEVRRTSLALHRNPSSQLFGPVVLESARNSGSGAPPGVALSPPSDAAAGADAAAADDDADAAAPIAEPPPTAASAEAEASAVRIQSRVRGAASRRDVWEVKNEKARLEWITYYLSIGDEEGALRLHWDGKNPPRAKGGGDSAGGGLPRCCMCIG